MSWIRFRLYFFSCRNEQKAATKKKTHFSRLKLFLHIHAMRFTLSNFWAQRWNESVRLQGMMKTHNSGCALAECECCPKSNTTTKHAKLNEWISLLLGKVFILFLVHFLFVPLCLIDARELASLGAEEKKRIASTWSLIPFKVFSCLHFSPFFLFVLSQFCARRLLLVHQMPQA